MTEKSIIESEKVFRELFNNMSTGVSVYDAIEDGNDFILKDMNKAGETINKFKKKDVIGKNLSDLFPGVKEYDTFFEVFKRVWKTGKSERIPTSLYKDERITQWVECYVYKLPSKRLVIMYNDVTEHRTTEMELQKLNEELEQRVEERANELVVSEEKYRNFFQQYKMLVESITDSVYVLDKDWNYVLVNEAAAGLVQLKADEMLNKNLITLFPGIEETQFFKAYKSVMETKKMERILSEFTHPDGRYGVYEVSVYPITEGILCIARDITEEKEIERKLNKSKEKYRNLSNQYEMLLESITDSIFALNSDWEYILVNKSAEAINNISRDNIIGKKMQDLFPGIEDTPSFKIYESVMNTRKEERIIESFTHPDGETKFYDLSVYPIDQGILCISRDVTEEREIQQELGESERKYRRAYNQTNLYKNIFAHDINNILQNIQASAELSSLYLNNPDKFLIFHLVS